LTGDKSLNVPAGCASSSLYKRKAPSSSAESNTSKHNGDTACGVGEWDAVWLGRADYLDNGLERDWSYRDVVVVDGEVVNVSTLTHQLISRSLRLMMMDRMMVIVDLMDLRRNYQRV
jgi:hypothetical protein